MWLVSFTRAAYDRGNGNEEDFGLCQGGFKMAECAAAPCSIQIAIPF
jgi:hypothetical protein